MQTFDLRYENWIGCEDLSGNIREVGLLELFSDAHSFHQLVCSNPLETASLLRMLVGMAHHLLDDIQDEQEWAEVFGTQHFGKKAVEEYFLGDELSDRFDLFHPSMPFWQHPTLRNIDSKSGEDRPVGIPILAISEASGNNRTIFSHRLDQDGMVVTPSHAARLLVTNQFFGIGGLNKKVSQQYGFQQSFMNAPLVGGMPTVVLGKSLFETVLLNMVPVRVRRQPPLGSWAVPLGAPPWSQDVHSEDALMRDATKKQTVPIDYLDYLLPWSRYIRLVPERSPDGVVVRHIHLAQGTAWPAEREIWFPKKPNKKNDAYLNVRLSPERAVWRDSTAILGVKDPGGLDYVAPLALHLYSRRVERYGEKLGLSTFARIAVLGLANSKAKPLLWRHETLSIPTLREEEHTKMDAIKSAVAVCESIGGVLRAAIKRFYLEALHVDDEEGIKHNSLPSRLSDRHRAIRTYWGELELPFRRFLTGDRIEEGFSSIAAQVALDAFDEFIATTVIDDSRLFPAMVQSRGQLSGSLRKRGLLPESNRKEVENE